MVAHLKMPRQKPLAAIQIGNAKSNYTVIVGLKWCRVTFQAQCKSYEELHAKGAPLYAITNWNGDTFRLTQGRFKFLSLFRDIVVSGDEKLVKPEPDIFHLLAKRNNIKLSDSIFIDDSAKNIKGAEAVGMKTHHFITPEGLRADLKRRNLL